MKKISYYNRDKSKWGDGPWRTEPDKMQWQDEATGYACVITRSESGSLCGYVGVKPGHKLHGAYPDDGGKYYIHCHGGWNFASECQHYPEGHGVCHIPDKGEDDNLWWLGFDCSHSRDFVPYYDLLHNELFARMSSGGEDPLSSLFGKKTYRDLKYVQMEVASMAKQMKALEA